MQRPPCQSENPACTRSLTQAGAGRPRGTPQVRIEERRSPGGVHNGPGGAPCPRVRTHLALYPVPGKSGLAFPSPGFKSAWGLQPGPVHTHPHPGPRQTTGDPHLCDTSVTVAGTIEDATASPMYSQSWAALVPGNHRILMASNSLAKAREVFKF